MALEELGFFSKEVRILGFIKVTQIEKKIAFYSSNLLLISRNRNFFWHFKGNFLGWTLKSLYTNLHFLVLHN